MEQLKEHRQFRNQCILMTLILFLAGAFLMMPFEFLSEDASQGAGTLFGFGFVMLLVSIFNIFSYRENKKDFKKLQELS